MLVKEVGMATLRTTLTLVAFAGALSGRYVVPVRGPDGTVM
jgi:hypothetical protein